MAKREVVIINRIDSCDQGCPQYRINTGGGEISKWCHITGRDLIDARCFDKKNIKRTYKNKKGITCEEVWGIPWWCPYLNKTIKCINKKTHQVILTSAGIPE